MPKVRNKFVALLIGFGNHIASSMSYSDLLICDMNISTVNWQNETYCEHVASANLHNGTNDLENDNPAKHAK